MIAGHFGFATAVKARERAVPLWLLLLACQWLDVLFVPLLLAGIEHLQPLSGTAPGTYGAAVIYADYTHSLVGALLLSLLLGAICLRRYGRRAAAVVALVAFSHWPLDLLMHRGDMPLLPGNSGGFPRVGLGLWRFPSASAAIELAIVLVGAALYWRAAVQVAAPDPALTRRARICGAGVLVAGVATLGLNVLGM